MILHRSSSTLATKHGSDDSRPSSEYRQISCQLSSLQEQVDVLRGNLNALQSRLDQNVKEGHVRPSPTGSVDPQIAFQSHVSPTPTPQQHGRQYFSGPTSAAFNFEVAKCSLQKMGITTHSGESTDDQARPTIEAPPQLTPTAEHTLSSLKDPLWLLDQQEALRLCTLFEEEVGTMHPIMNMEKTMKKAKTLFAFLDSMERVGFLRKEIEQGDSLDDEETLVLKMILATALIIESGGRSELGRNLHESARRIVYSRDSLGKPPSIQFLQLLVIKVCQLAFFRRCEAIVLLEVR